MIRMTDRELLGWVTGGLDPGRARLVEEAVSASPDLQRRLAGLVGRLPLDAPAPSRWRLPPPGHALHMRAAEAAAMTFDEVLHPGEPFVVQVGGVVDPERRQVVVLHRVEGEWVVVFPRGAEEVLPLASLPMEDEGYRLVLTCGSETGRQRWAVLLPLLDLAVDWQATVPWSGLMAAADGGEVPMLTVEVETGT